MEAVSRWVAWKPTSDVAKMVEAESSSRRVADLTR